MDVRKTELDTGQIHNADGTVSVYLYSDRGPQRWTFDQAIEHDPGCGCWECITF
jgi:hypothetical protein